MLNFDKYREEVEKRTGWAVRAGAKNPKPVHLILKEIVVGKCLPCMNSDELVDWLFEEYEPPLLENGDGLKPGDWIMVRYYTADKWHKRQFMCFYNGVFYTAEGPFDMVGHHTFSRWHDARLPEEGE